jgi:hypothetical protein
MNDAPIIETDNTVAPRVGVDFPSGIRFGFNGGLDADDLFKRALGSSERISPAAESPEDAPKGTGGGEVLTFSFKGKKTAALEFTIQPGAIELGPDTVIEWTAIKDSGGTNPISSTQTIPSGNTAWYVWANIDVSDGAESAKILTGASIAALNSTEKKTIRQKLLIQVAIVSDNITTVKNLQCGNIDIPRL